MKILIVPIGKIDSEVLRMISESIYKTFNSNVVSERQMLIPQNSYNSSRKQNYSTIILNTLNVLKSKGVDRVLGIADVDLYVPDLNFVFGEADMSTGIAVISLTRLRQEFYGLRPDKKLFHERAVKEAIHEIGHTLGLGHCPDPKCVMHFSNSLRDTDMKLSKFCGICKNRIKQF
jgi:archaemetzincin